MFVEVSVAVNYILSHLYSKLPRRRVDSFGEELQKHMCVKFQHHWYPNEPARESNFRCLSASGCYVDPLFSESATVSGLDWSEIQACLPEKLLLNVDPGYVACQYQQMSHTNYDYNRYPSNSQWPSSISLSSSGCSSASSNSSNSLVPSSIQMVHQVLYCIQEGWAAHNEMWPEVAVRSAKIEQEQGDQLATATALSVLVDAEDNIASDIGSRPTQYEKLSLTLQNLWSTISSKPEGLDINGEMHASDTGFNSMESSKLELSSGYEADQFNNNLIRASSENESESCLISPFTSDITGGTRPNGLSAKNEGPQTFSFLNKSSSDLQHIEKSNTNCARDCTMLGSNSSWGGTTMPQFQSRFEQQLNRLFGVPQTRMNSGYPSALIKNATNPFVQKSTSTPSFTAATFAQTKFGSTKLKNHAKRAPNRILSPTVAPPPIPSVPRESVLSTILGTNQRLPQASNVELFSFRRLQPNPLENSFSQALIKQPIPRETHFAVDCSNVERVSEDHSNSPSDSSSGSGEFRHLSFGAQPQATSSVVGARSPTTPNYCFHEPMKHGIKSVPNASAQWPRSLLQFCHENTSCSDDKCVSSLEWTQVASLPLSGQQDTWSGDKQEFGLVSSLNRDNHTGSISLAEDALLSARMVNLLLEDDNASDSIAPESGHIEDTAVLPSHSCEQTVVNYEPREMNALLDGAPVFSDTLLNATFDDALSASSEVTQQAGSQIQ